MKNIDFKTLVVEDIDFGDAPDFSDAFIAEGLFTDGTAIDDATLDELNSDSAFVYNAVINQIY